LLAEEEDQRDADPDARDRLARDPDVDRVATAITIGTLHTHAGPPGRGAERDDGVEADDR